MTSLTFSIFSHSIFDKDFKDAAFVDYKLSYAFALTLVGSVLYFVSAPLQAKAE
jgi:hypothetical protein